jgi:hypothetical protein
MEEKPKRLGSGRFGLETTSRKGVEDFFFSTGPPLLWARAAVIEG